MNYIKILASLLFFVSVCVNTTDAQKKHKGKKAKSTTTQKKTATKGKGKKKPSGPRVKPLIHAIKGDDNEAQNYTEAEATSTKVAPEDTLETKTVVITSAFKPSLKTAAKINFYAATPVIDTTKIPLTYQVPSQNLFFSYQPVPLKPLALNIDSSLKWENHAYVKVGFGNYSTPFIEAVANFGNPNSKAYQVAFNHVSSKGDADFQKYGKTGISATGTFASKRNTELNTKIYFDNTTQYKYGINKLDTFTEDQLKQSFNSFGFDAALHNKAPNKYNIIYTPEVKFNYFYDNNKGSEVSGLAKVNLQKINELMTINMGFVADMSSYSYSINDSTKKTVQNGVYYFDPYIKLRATNVTFKLGILPTWDNQSFHFLPNFTADYKLNDKRTVLQAGYVGYVQKNTYRSLTKTNPFIDHPSDLNNTVVKEFYLGFKSTAGKHLNYNGRIGLKQWQNMPLFISDSTLHNVQTYNTYYESQLNALQIHGEISYQLQEKLSMMGSITYNQYTKQNDYKQPFGLTPLEITGSARYYILKDIMLKGDLFYKDGTYYQVMGKENGQVGSGVDLNLGVQFNLMPKLDLFMQFNNIFSSNYQNWNRYQPLGFNVLGGVVYSFR